MIFCVTICEFHVSVTGELFVSNCYQNNKFSLYFPLQDCTNNCVFNFIKIKNYIEFIKNMLFVHFANLLKRQNNNLDYLIFRSTR